MAPEALGAVERDLLGRQLRYVWDASSFSRRKWEQAGVAPDRLRSPEDLVRLPFTEKRELQEARGEPPPFGANQCVRSSDSRRCRRPTGRVASRFGWR
jgi:phenylacetate-CoA ligase